MNSEANPYEPVSENPQEKLVGTWRLISAEDFDSQTGKWVPYTFGNPPSGYFIYDATGHASIQIMTTPPQKIAVVYGLSPARMTDTQRRGICKGDRRRRVAARRRESETNHPLHRRRGRVSEYF